ncbi:hypothetical protein N7466_007389 [Penicillium verhagenii]|uniref:uncharacterized protein n=1 Tax=Penicillium verhagenii TaxID=1562060 RepID=UPI002545A389|nr:uncharacterized protein N7466_007389 [Penicillium verhagenii]KAJ5928433.1 hypothetical protein N7466_007389 [Penicillium verhagenii]
MATAEDVDPIIYPAYCFKASPTHFAWVKMAIADVHRLKKPRNFEGQKVFFYKNHPVRFVTVAGLIVSRTEVFRRTILTLDDSSGATIEVAVLHSTDPKHTASTVPAPTAAQGRGPAIQEGGGSGSMEDYEADQAAFTITGDSSASALQAAMARKEPVHTTATDLTILDISALVPGVTVKVKGTLGSFRSIMQLHLERFTVLRDTNAEMQFVFERLQFLVETLNVPWVLCEEEVEELRVEGREAALRDVEEREKALRKIKRKAEREEKDERHIARRYKAEEREREKDAGACREDGIRVMREIWERKRSRLQGEGGS